MLEFIKFENTTGKEMQVCIEPFAHLIDWGIGQSLEIRFKQANDRFNDEFDVVLTEFGMVIYECRQLEMTVFVNKELKYSTIEDLY